MALFEVFLLGCGRSGKDSDEIPRELESWISLEVPAPEVEEVVMLERGTFAGVASSIYGHRNFAGFLAVANGVPDPDVVRMDVIYRTPGLTHPFENTRLNPRSLAAVYVLAVAATQFRSASELSESEEGCGGGTR